MEVLSPPDGSDFTLRVFQAFPRKLVQQEVFFGGGMHTFIHLKDNLRYYHLSKKCFEYLRELYLMIRLLYQMEGFAVPYFIRLWLGVI